MTGMLKEIKKQKYGVPADVISVFDDIYDKYSGGPGNILDEEFSRAMSERLTKELRFKIFETQGGCNGTGADKERKAFATEHAHLPLEERLAKFFETFGKRRLTLNGDGTMTLTFKCSHGYYKRAKEGKIAALPPTVEGYFERCAGGRLYELQKALGIKLKIKSVDVSPLSEDVNNPVVFTFEIEE